MNTPHPRITAVPTVYFGSISWGAYLFLRPAKCSTFAPPSPGYQRWHSEARDALFQKLSYVSCSTPLIFDSIIPKCASDVELSVLSKLSGKSPLALRDLTSTGNTKHFILYQEATQYWVKAAVGVPYYARDGRKGAQPHARSIHFASREAAQRAFALLNSSLFNVYFVAFSDCFHLSDFVACSFPIAPSIKADRRLPSLGASLMIDLKKNAERKRINTSDGSTITYDEYYASRSKPIIDRIDRVLARHYGFTDEELDFIINYDIKYRMGSALTEED